MKATIRQPSADSEQEEEVCFSCLGTNVPGTHFCKHCGTPLTSYATTAPLEHVFAFGDFLRKATTPGRWSRWVRMTVLSAALLMMVMILLGIFLP
jgi:hypothetical protein